MSDQIQPDFSVMAPKPIEVALYTRREVLKVMPIMLPQIAGVIHACAPFVADFQKIKTTQQLNTETVTHLILAHVEELPEMLAACCGRPVEYFRGNGTEEMPMLQLDEFMELALAVFSQNVDFFTRRLLPFASQAGALLVGRLRKPVEKQQPLTGTATAPKKAASTGAGASKP